MKILPIIVLILLFSNKTIAQSDSLKVIDSTSVITHEIKKKWDDSRYVHESIVPLSLALGSVAIISIPGLKESLQKPLIWNYNSTTTGINGNLFEDQIRYVPAIAAYAISFCGVK